MFPDIFYLLEGLIKRLNLQHSNLSAQLQANTEKEETLINLQEAAYKQQEEIKKLNKKLGQLSILLILPLKPTTKQHFLLEDILKK